MYFKFLNVTLAGLLLSVSGIVNAGLITDTSNNSFIDTTSGLEWMDFGVNDHYSFNQVKSLLATEYVGWMLATETQVEQLIHNAFSGVGSTSHVFQNQNSYSVYRTYTENFDNIWNPMGFNTSSGVAINRFGWFESDTPSGGLANIAMVDRHVLGDLDEVNVTGKFRASETNRTMIHREYSTMLVRGNGSPIPSVPEPSTIAIFALGILGLASRKFKKNS